MSPGPQIILASVSMIALATLSVTALAMRRGMHRWFTPKLLAAGQRSAREANRPVHLLLCLCDHYEPGHGNVTREIAAQRVQGWVTEYPKVFDRFRDADGQP